MLMSVLHYSVLQVWHPDSCLTLWIKEGTSKEMPDKKRKRAIRSGCTLKSLKTTGCKMGLSHLPTLWYSSQSANFQSFLRTAQALIENGFSSLEIPFPCLGRCLGNSW